MNSADSVYILLSLILASYLIYRWSNRASIADIPGPEPESWWLGVYGQTGLYFRVHDRQEIIVNSFKDK